MTGNTTGTRVHPKVPSHNSRFDLNLQRGHRMRREHLYFLGINRQEAHRIHGSSTERYPLPPLAAKPTPPTEHAAPRQQLHAHDGNEARHKICKGPSSSAELAAIIESSKVPSISKVLCFRFNAARSGVERVRLGLSNSTRHWHVLLLFMV